MLLTITLIISGLVALNLLLLKFSCNKTIKPKKVDRKPVILNTRISIPTSQQILAPTGS